MHPQGIHHLTFVVRSLEASINSWIVALGVQPEFESLPGRGVRAARFALGSASIVLVEPVEPTGLPGQYLAAHGEGLLLVSLEVTSLDEAVAALRARGGSMAGERRAGIAGWTVQDLQSRPSASPTIQYCAAGTRR